MSDFASAHVLPSGRFFQLGYVARNLERGVETFAARYGVRDFLHYLGTPALKVALAYAGEVMIEIIVTGPPAEPLYADAAEQGELILHHLGYLVDADTWAQLPETLGALDIPITKMGQGATGIGFLYADTRKDLGHYSEYVYLPEAGGPYFTDVPRN